MSYLQVGVGLDGVAAGEGKVLRPMEVFDDGGHGIGSKLSSITHVQLYKAAALLGQNPDICREPLLM